VARRATIIDNEREKNTNALVLDAGNSLVGDQDPAAKSEGKTSVEVMNRMGYDAAGIGPGDLLLGPVALKQRIAEAKFPLLSANAYIKSDGEALAEPFVVQEIAGHRVAIVGLTGGTGTDQYEVRDPLSAVEAVMNEIKGQADEVILLSTAGAETDQKIADMVPGITAIISGGTARPDQPWVSQTTGTPVFHADRPSPGHTGRYIGVADLSLGPDGKLIDQKWRQVMLGPEIASNEDISAWVTEVAAAQ